MIKGEEKHEKIPVVRCSREFRAEKKNLIQFTPNFQFFPLLVVRQISERNGEIMRSEMERNKARLGVIKKMYVERNKLSLIRLLP